jgi:hypothetical protein
MVEREDNPVKLSPPQTLPKLKKPLYVDFGEKG